MTPLEAMLDAVVEPARPHDPALLDARAAVLATRGVLGARVRARAAAFARAGIEPGTAVAFGVRQDADGIAWLLGAIRAGLAVVVLDPGIAPALLEARCRAAGVEAVVTDGGVATVAGSRSLRWVARRRGVHVPDLARLARRHWATSRTLARIPRLEPVPHGDARRPLPAEAAALVLFTSGTTDAPRGVVHTPSSLAATLKQAAGLVELGPGDRVLGTGFHLVAPALLAGASVVVPPGRGRTRVLARATRAAGVTHLSLPLHVAVDWAAAGGASARLRAVLLGSAPVRNAALAPLARMLPGVRVSSVYGMTEHLLVSMVDVDERLAFDERHGDLVGRPLPGVRLRTDEAGELHVGGPALARGYLDEPQPVAELPTGDLGSVDASGRLVLRGRRKEMVIRRGENIYPSLYEPALAAAARLEAALMVGVERPDGDEAVVLFAVPAGGDDPERARRRLASVVASSASPLDAHARPDLVLAVPRVPRAGRSGKPDRQALAAIAAARREAGR
jgi:acyl-CoA synthetase (AMP-forming)/AMP-acid ligase II